MSAAHACDECGRDMPKAHKRHHGRAFCDVCYPRLFKPRPCVKCGEPARVLAQDPRPICRTCEKSSRTCIRCERPIQKAGLIFNGKPVCPSCAPHFREPKPCPSCKKPSKRLSRIVGVTDEPVCDACRRKLTCATCSVCGKHRERHALTPEGKPLCKRCAADPNATHVCPDCGTTVGSSGDNPCMPCQMVRTLRRKADVLVSMYTHPESRRVFLDFVGWVVAKKVVNKALGPLPRYADYLQRIDLVLQGGESLQPRHVTDALTTEEIRRAGLLAMFLSEQGLLADSARTRTDSSDMRRIQNILREADKGPWANLMRQYADEIGSAEIKLRPRTQRLYLRAALEFLKSSGASQARELASGHVRKFLRSRPGHRASLQPLLVFLAARMGHGLSLPKKPQGKVRTIRSQTDTVARLLKAARAAEPAHERRALVAKLISTLYGTPLERVLELDRSCVEALGDGLRIRLGGDWVKVEEPVASLLRKVVVQAGDVEDSRLFPGRLNGDRLSVGGVTYYLREMTAS